VDHEVLEPFEEVVIEVDPEFQGAVMQTIGERKGEVTNIIKNPAGSIRIEFIVATRALIGFRGEFLMMTRGTGIMYQNFLEYQEYKGEMPERSTGVMVSMTGNKAVAYALWNLQPRGEIFVRPYEGMVIGVNNKGDDIVVNAEREKKLTNIRAAGSDDAIQLITPRELTLEFALEFIARDELVEVTPRNIRLRKLHLSENERRYAAKAALS
jgi:GTP-binding protein